MDYTVDGKYMQVKVPKSMLSLSGYDFTINFTWTDNVHDEADAGNRGDENYKYTTFSGDIMDFYISGDVAPSGRFKYSYISTKENAGDATTVETQTTDTQAQEPDTQGETPDQTQSDATETQGEDVATQNGDTTTVEAEGCQSSINMAMALLALLGGAVCLTKKRD